MAKKQAATTEIETEVAKLPLSDVSEKYAHIELTKKRIDELIPHEINPRIHPDEQIEKVQHWIRELDYYKNIVVEAGTNKVLAGHGILEALKREGYVYVDVNEKELLPEMALALMAWDNKSGELSFWDQVNLIAIQSELTEMDVEMEPMGFADGEIDSMGSNAVVEEDDPPEVSEEPPITQTGDLWLLGKHRVLCGDSTKVEDVERVMGGEKADMITDPPYGIGYQYESHDDSDNDANLLLVKNAFAMVFGVKVWTCGSMNLWRDLRWNPEAKVMCWHKKFAQAGNGIGGASTWEPVLALNVEGGTLPNDYLEFPTDREEGLREQHPCPKPVRLYGHLIQHLTHGDIYDPFLGSGTTLIAADQLDRICYGLEIAPKYCDVIVKRYINHVGSDEHVSVERKGKTLSWEQAQKKLPKVI